MKNITFILYCCSAFILCNCKQKSEKNTILTADREAPMGWVKLKIYEDQTFEFITSGFREDVIYPGKVKRSNDTLYFEYSGKTPKVGKIGVIKNNFITYIKGTYVESLQIKKGLK